MKKGFTLVELLVVISIIALLLAILIPALNMAMELAMRIKCGSNMRNLGVALNNYIGMSANKLPPCPYQTTGTPASYVPWRTGDPEYPSEIHNPWMSFLVLEHFDPTLDTPKERFESGIHRGLAFLYATKLIRNPEVFYCPSAPKNKGDITASENVPFDYSAYHGEGEDWPWLDLKYYKLAWYFVRSSFCYMPQHVSREGNPLTDPAGGPAIEYPLIAQKAADLAPGKALAVDTIHTLRMLAHKTGPLGGGRGLNLMYSDFSVGFVANQQAFREYLWKNSDGSDRLMGNAEPYFRRVVKILEETH